MEWLFRTDCSVSIPPDAEKFSALAERLEIRGDRIELFPTFVDAIEPRIRNIADVNYKVEFFAFSSVDDPFQRVDVPVVVTIQRSRSTSTSSAAIVGSP